MKCLKCGKEIIEGENTICDECKKKLLVEIEEETIEEVVVEREIFENKKDKKDKGNFFLIIIVVLSVVLPFLIITPRIIGYERETYTFEDDLDGDNITESIKIEQKIKTYDTFNIIERLQIALDILCYDGNDTYTSSNFKIYINGVLIEKIRELIDVVNVGVYTINNEKGIGFLMHKGWITNPSTEIELNILENDKFRKIKYTIKDSLLPGMIFTDFNRYNEYTYADIVGAIYSYYEEAKIYVEFNDTTILIDSIDKLTNILEKNKKYEVLVKIEKGMYKLIVNEKI